MGAADRPDGGVAIMAYAADRPRARHLAAVSATAAVWLLLTVTLGGYALSQSLSIRVIALDSSVNLVALVTASLAGSWSQDQV
jgi:hypothetical protein